MSRVPVIFDNDAGSDIDDLWALGLVMAHPGPPLPQGPRAESLSAPPSSRSSRKAPEHGRSGAGNHLEILTRVGTLPSQAI
jgi:hypothetical protein